MYKNLIARLFWLLKMGRYLLYIFWLYEF